MADAREWDGLTITGELPVGVFYAGSRHKTFTLRTSLSGDLISAQEAFPEGPMQLITVDVYRRQLLSLGDIPVDALTTELLREHLSEIDLQALAVADRELEKKLTPLKSGSEIGGESSTSSSNTATDSTK
ncbi:hypothetical protein R84981_001705 [Carnimonas sp. R-84981]|uniref:hypothetical protein n=1 Tax=Carnimonas bestiolae TaxID=3402172 RepID=UPI003EDB925C